MKLTDKKIIQALKKGQCIKRQGSETKVQVNKWIYYISISISDIEADDWEVVEE